MLTRIETDIRKGLVALDPKNYESHPIQCALKAFECSIVAPDHCCIRNVRNMLEALFTSLNSAEEQKRSNVLYYACTTLNDLPLERNVFNVEKNKLNNTTFSTSFVIFSVSLPVCIQFARLFPSDCTPSFKKLLPLLSIFAQLVNLIYYWPFEHADGSLQTQLVLGKHRNSYFVCLQRMASQYVKKVNDCLISGVTAAVALDKPNLHRLLELVMHTIPRFGHARFVSDWTSEHKHKDLKPLYRRGNNLGYNHVWSFTQELFDFWKTDLAYAFRESELENISAPVKPSVYLDKLFRLLFGLPYPIGSDITAVQARTEGFAKCKQLYNDLVQKDLEPLVHWNETLIQRRSSHWKPFHKAPFVKPNCIPQDVRSLVHNKFPTTSTCFIRGLIRHVTPVQKMVPTSVVYVIRDSSQHVHYDVYVVRYIVKVDVMSFVLLVQECESLKDMELNVGNAVARIPVKVQGLTVLRISPFSNWTKSVRKASVIHFCSSACRWNSEEEAVEHSETLVNGGKFCIQTKINGYPPHSG